MAEKKLARPDSRNTKRMIAIATNIDRCLYAVAQGQAEQQQAVRQAANALLEENVRQAMAQMDIAHINNGKQGIRVGLLREAGIENVLEVSEKSLRQICAIEGLGEQSAQKILSTAKQIAQNTRQTLRCRIRADEPTEQDDALVEALYRLLETDKLRKACSDLYAANHTPVQKELELAKKSLNGIGWLFRSAGAKTQILCATESLHARLCGSFGDGKLLGQVADIEKATTAQCREDFARNAAAYYAALEALGITWATAEVTQNDLPEELALSIEGHSADLRYLKATLRSYQDFGVKYILHQKKTLLGDEMGLGKTIQAIAAMAALKAEGKTHFMVVCPASVLVNWCREVPKHSHLQATKIHGNDEAALQHWLETGDVAVTTYESISRFTLPEDLAIAMVVTDEAHYVKNPETRRTKALQTLLQQAEYVLFMTGTPLENRVDEMCFLVSMLQPDIAKKVQRVKYVATAKQFRQRLAPVYLRRTREDVLQELPELIEKEQWCELTKEEKKAYKRSVKSENFMAMRQVCWDVEDLAQSSKAARLLELCDQAAEQGRKVIVFSFFRNTIQRVTELLADRCLEPITGAITPQRRQQIVDAFDKADPGAVLVSQVQAGGTGLNIQSASVIIFCEPQIKPSIENQAISRAYRMGQVHDVLVYRLLADDTVDERLMEILKDKQDIFDNFADESYVGTESLKPGANKTIAQLVAAEKARLRDE